MQSLFVASHDNGDLAVRSSKAEPRMLLH